MVKKILYLETIDQVRALMEPSRQQIIREMSDGATTSREIAQAMGGSVPKIHYHLKELEKHGLIRKIRQTQKGNLVESHYEPTARSFRSRTHLAKELASDSASYQDLLTRTLLVASSTVEDTVVEIVNLVEEASPEAFEAEVRPTLLENAISADLTTLHMNQEEYDEFLAHYQSLLKQYKKNRRSRKRKSVDVFWMSLPNRESIFAAQG